MHHGEGLRRLLSARGLPPHRREALLAALAADHRSGGFEPADLAMLDYVEALTVRPGEVDATDVEALRDAGFDDVAIHDICAVTAYYAFVNRIADGLGVELEEGRGGPGSDGDGSAASAPGEPA